MLPPQGLGHGWALRDRKRRNDIDMVRALFLAAFDADEPFPQIMSQDLGAGGTPTDAGLRARVVVRCDWECAPIAA